VADKIDLQRVFRKLKRIALRQESTIFDRKYFVDEHLTESLKTANWQVIYGRRGAGKTTNFLSMIDEINSSKYPTNSLAIYIDLSRSMPSETGASTEIDAQRITATKYFQDFVRAFGLQLLDLCTEPSERLIHKKLAGSGKDRQRLIESVILDIASFSDMTDAVRSAKANGESDPRETSISSTGIREEDVETTGNKRAVSTFVAIEAGKYGALADSIQRFRELLELDMIYILIDEWTSLDKSGKLQIQPLFAELLNRTFKQIPGVTVKISAIRGTTVFFRKDAATQIGLEPGDDIYEAHDLDELHTSNAHGNDFFENLIYKKMIEADASVLHYSKVTEEGKATFEPKDGFIRSFFKEENLFDMLVEASGRIPRVFLELFTEIAAKLGYVRGKPWTRDRLLSEIVGRSFRARQEVERMDRFRGFYQRTCEIAAATNQRVFFVPRNEGELFADIISDLFHFKLIHNVDIRIIPTDVDRHFRVYVLDYGTYLDVTGAYKDTSYTLEAIDMSDPAYLEDIELYTIHAAEVDFESVVCSNCDRSIVLNHPSVTTAGVCYNCYHPIEIRRI